MPYIITPCPRGCRAEDMESRTAVATLGEARDAAENAVNDVLDPLVSEAAESGGIESREAQRLRRIAMSQTAEAHGLPEQGGTVGPLPDGYVIDVQHVTWHELAKSAGWPDGKASVPALILDAYNAR